MYRRAYFGPYMRVWMPETESSISTQTCTNEGCEKYGKHVASKFCPQCGSLVATVLMKKWSRLNLHEFLEKELNNIDMFQVVYPDDVDYVIAVSNITSKQGGTFFEDESEVEVLIFQDNKQKFEADFEKEDWVKFEEALKAKDIKCEKLTGILQWFN